MSKTTPLKPNELIIKLAAKINTSQEIIWVEMAEIFSEELKKRDENIYNSFLNNWSSYTKTRGIEVQRSAEHEQKLLLAIYEYRHFTKGVSANYSIFKEDIDNSVRKDIKNLMRLIKGAPSSKLKEDIQNINELSSVIDFEKLFSADGVFNF